MFTGIVKGLATLARIEAHADGIRWVVAFPSSLPKRRSALGESIALDGVCLTVAGKEEAGICFDLSRETLKRTTADLKVVGAFLNYELALLAGEPLGGHQVLGHVDAVGEVLSYRPLFESHELIIQPPTTLSPLIAEKGSIAVDGASLTVNHVADSGAFHINIIPHTHEKSRCRFYEAGTKVNLEADPMARYIENYLRWMKS